MYCSHKGNGYVGSSLSRRSFFFARFFFLTPLYDIAISVIIWYN